MSEQTMGLPGRDGKSEQENSTEDRFKLAPVQLGPWEHVGFVDMDTGQIMVGNPRYERPSREDCDAAYANEIQQVRDGGLCPALILATRDPGTQAAVSVRRDPEGMIVEIKVKVRDYWPTVEDIEQIVREHWTGGDD